MAKKAFLRKGTEGAQLSLGRIAGAGKAVICLLLLLVLLKPAFNHSLSYFLGFPCGISDEVCSAVTFAISVLVVVVGIARGKLDVFTSFVAALCVLVSVATLVNEGDMLVVVNEWLPLLAVSMMVALCPRRQMGKLVELFFVACLFYLIANLICLLREPTLLGVSSVDELLFGYRNVTFRIAIPALCCSFLMDSLKGKKWSLRTAAVLCVVVFELLVGYSATAVCAVAAMVLLNILVIWMRPRKICNALSYLIGYIALFIGFVIFRVQNLLSFIIEPVLHRSVTFTGRTEIWDDTFAHLSDLHLLTGYGTGYLWTTVGINGTPQKHTHNDILNALMLGGLPMLLCFLAILVASVRSLYLHRAERNAAVVGVGLAGFFIVSLVEVSVCPGLFFILSIAVYFFKAPDVR